MKYFITILFILTSLNLTAQVSEEWVRRYNGSSNVYDGGTSLVTDNTGNIFITGVTNNSEIVTIKYNSSGIQQWISTYSAPGNSGQYSTSISVDDSGNVYIAGHTWIFSTSNGEDYLTLKYNSNGVEQWARIYNGPGNREDYILAMTTDESGNVYVTGLSSTSIQNEDYYTIKYNSSGDEQWARRYNGPGDSHDQAYAISVDELGNVYVTGYSNGSGTSGDYATIKYNSLGLEQWVSRYNGPGNRSDLAYSLALDNSGNVYVTGRSEHGPLHTDDDYATIKYNSSGVEQWVRRYNSPSDLTDKAYSIAVDDNGNVFVTGVSYSTITNADYATIKYNSSGVEQWVMRYNGLGNSCDSSGSIILDNYGNAYVTGISRHGSLFGTEDYTTIRYHSSGTEQWIARYNGPGDMEDFPYSAILDGAGNVIVTGYSIGNGTQQDITTIKYSQSVGISLISSKIPETYSLLQNYPNPFNPETKIVFNVPEHVLNDKTVKLSVFDGSGKLVAILVNENLKPGKYAYNFDGKGLSSGIYYYKMQSGNYMETKKMILVK